MAQEATSPLGVGIIGTGFGLMPVLGFRKCDNVRVVAVCQRTQEFEKFPSARYTSPS